MITSRDLKYLSEEDVTKYQRDGFLKVENIINQSGIDLLGQHADFIASGQAANIPETSLQLEPVFRDAKAVDDRVLSTRKLFNMALYDEQLWGHVTIPKVVDIVSDLLGSDDITFFGDQLFMKSPKYGSAKGWHQDSESFRDLFPMDFVTAWTAIDPATVENGCLQFIPGTHRWGMLTPQQLNHFVEDFDGDEWPSVPAPLSPGGISFHHSLTLHSSSKNTSTARRRGYAVHYMRSSSWQDKTVDSVKMPGFKLVRGKSYQNRV